jgi:hypothetical protein
MVKTCLRLLFFVCLGFLGSTISYSQLDTTQVEAENAFATTRSGDLTQDLISSLCFSTFSQREDEGYHHHDIGMADVEEQEDEEKKYSLSFRRHLSRYLSALCGLFSIDQITSQWFLSVNESKPIIHVRSFLLFEVFRI